MTDLSTRTITADEIADALGRPRPTAQQRAVIEAEDGPALVVAGAGSGKTETMANRVLWLLANGRVRPSEVLGLTFTRKAAGELAVRIRERIAQLEASGLELVRPARDDEPMTDAVVATTASVAPGVGAASVAGTHIDEFDVPTIATYNAFAATLCRDNAMAIGRESDGAVLGEAAAWQLARSVVLEAHDDRLPDLDKTADLLTSAVLELARAMAENVVDADDVRRVAREVGALDALPLGDRAVRQPVIDRVRPVAALDVLVDLALEFERRKSSRDLIEFSDQVALALRVVRRAPKVVAELRSRYRVVLLDEYQDTSVSQTWLLSELFGGMSVMAVGDPNQSIYGWRGASAANLEQFSAQFAESLGAPPAQRFSLSTSWRNGHGILAAANVLAAPLAAVTRVPVLPLDASPIASGAPVDSVVAETIEEEAEAVARWFASILNAPRHPERAVPSAALLFRARAAQPPFLAALRRAGVPFHVLGVAGLLAEPEIADLVSALRVVHDPTAGTELVRLLAGSRWRIGVRDLHALSRLASWLRDRDHAYQRLDDDVKQLFRDSVAEGESGSIVEALDFLVDARDGHSELGRFSAEGLERMRDAGRVFRRLRARAGLELVDFIAYVEQDFQLDIEVAANESRALGAANRDALADALTGYLAVAESSSLGGFLSWLDEAQRREDLAARQEEPEPGTVQVLTIHSAKGLEWDAVAVPRLVRDEVPSKPRDSTGWLSLGRLPYELRGDAADLPVLAWRAATTRKELAAAIDAFKVEVAERHAREERRLAYVAVTRARHRLLLSASFWGRQVAPRPPSVFLEELAAAGVVPSLPAEPAASENPLGDQASLFSWPIDPLGERRARVEAAAEAVRAAEPGHAGRWQRDLDLLLAEREARSAGDAGIRVPSRVPASRFKDWVTDAAAVARDLRRPMPERPYRATRLGTVFHRWVEQRYGAGVRGGASSDELDALGTELDVAEFAEEERLAELRATFERSPWAGRAPLEVEREIELVLDGQVIVCKIDAVYAADGDRLEIVDWKTGKAPRDAADLEAKQFQLALYRLAYARWRGIDPDRIDALFYFVADDEVVRPARVYDEAELVAAWRAATTKR
ncbi:ATP-dependent DNA helicase [Galbitalea sp. SE-J8]|uniref:ATP-dependent helicase n=1 Tax=Galbitalea sp. SE-J8 TaxID=3054952 RepID=UPI00259C6D48|nr:ATP-dependent DNA helicase [Galbitalea sp. SE-J8]MDM4763514.1 ATP-dependent DNA helicase [Galbitalea sp. SE-J8]